jgi:hypothetical protein
LNRYRGLSTYLRKHVIQGIGINIWRTLRVSDVKNFSMHVLEEERETENPIKRGKYQLWEIFVGVGTDSKVYSYVGGGAGGGGNYYYYYYYYYYYCGFQM